MSIPNLLNGATGIPDKLPALGLVTSVTGTAPTRLIFWTLRQKLGDVNQQDGVTRPPQFEQGETVALHANKKASRWFGAARVKGGKTLTGDEAVVRLA